MSKELEALRDFWNPVVKQIVSNLNTMYDTGRSGTPHNRNASGNTGHEIGAKNVDIAHETIEAYIIELTFPSYSLYIDEGVRGWQNTAKTTGRFSFKRQGKRIPTTAIRSFMLNRGIVPRNESGKRTKPLDMNKALNSMAYRIGVAIKREGIDMVPFISSVINDELIKRYKVFISEVVGRRIKEEIILNFNTDQAAQKV